MEASYAPPSTPSRPISLAAFETFWAELRSTLQPNAEIRGWGAARGYTAMRFRVTDVERAAVTVASSTMSAPRRVSKGEFAKLYRLWDDYCAGRVSRAAVTAISQNSSYIFAILRHHADRRERV